MKTTKIYLALTLLSFVAWSCTTQDDLSSNKSLKTSINASAVSLTSAVNSITSAYIVKVTGANGGMDYYIKNQIA